MVRRLEHLLNEERLRELSLCSHEKRMTENLSNVSEREVSENGSRLFLVVPSNRTRDNGRN